MSCRLPIRRRCSHVVYRIAVWKIEKYSQKNYKVNEIAGFYSKIIIIIIIIISLLNVDANTKLKITIKKKL